VDLKFKEKMNILDEIKKDYNLSPILYEEIKQALKFETERDKSEVMSFIDFLP